jgi:hypothetical protein
MALSLWISSAVQYGVPARGEARQGTLQRAVAQSIKRHLFADETIYARVLKDFAVKLQPALKVKNQMVIDLWRSLFLEDADNGELSERQHDEVAEPVENLFCLALYALCAVLAKQWVEDASRDTESEEDDSEEIGDGVPDFTANAVEYFQVVSTLVFPLRQHMWKWQHKLLEDQIPDDKTWYVVSGVLVATLLESLDDWFEVQTGTTCHSDGKPHTEKTIAIRQPELAQRINDLLEKLPLSFTAQPLKQPVAYHFDDSGLADDTADTCIRLDLIGYRQKNDFLRRTHHHLLQPQHRPPNFERYVEAINLQQAVPWRINRVLLNQVRQLIDVMKTESAATDDLVAWIKKHLYHPINERPKAVFSKKTDDPSARAAEFLDSPLVKLALDELCPDNSTDSLTFYLPWKADYRGRIYAQTPYFTPQGGDLQRALLEFTNGQVLTDSGASALRRHGANLVKRERLLKDLGIDGRPVITFDERERWVSAHESEILASAESPLTESFWREVADKPMQFLAFCLAYQQWHTHPELPVYLPVQIDGTCNGLQHIAALTGDVALAEAVNVFPHENGLPADIYNGLAAVARQTLGTLTDSKSLGIKLADTWLAADSARRDWLNRKTAKKVVMTIPYGASKNAQARGVLEVDALEQTILADWQRDPPSLSELDALVKLKENDKNAKRFVAKCSRDLFNAQRQLAFAADDELTQALAKAEWERLRTFASYVALTLVEHLHNALNTLYPHVHHFSDWLKKTATACAGSGRKDKNDTRDVGIPLLWLTPLGFPVIQSGFQVKSIGTEPRLGNQKFRVDVKVLQEELDPNKQGNGLLPNLIHSLDATHLAKTLFAAQQQGIDDVGSIHDCLLCHPNAADKLSDIVRTTFTELYAPDKQTGRSQPLAAWYGWMQEVVALRTLPHRGTVQAALVHAGGLGERILNNDADFGKLDAQAARNWLAKVRGQEITETELFLLQALLAWAVELKLLTPNKEPQLPDPPVKVALPFAQRPMSPYFFS